MIKRKEKIIESPKNLDEEASLIGMGGNIDTGINEDSYKKRMQVRKEIQTQRLKIRKDQKGLIIVFTGNGKGKTTASLGMVLRTIGHGHKAAIIQFIKGAWTTGEENALKKLSKEVAWHSLGEGFTWETQDRIRDKKFVNEAWDVAKKYIKDDQYKLVLLDEINIAIKLGYIKSDEITKFIKRFKGKNKHIVLTGRGASEKIVEFADLVTEMKLVKHPFKDQGIKAQKCVEY